MSAIGTHRRCRPSKKPFCYWRLTGSAMAVPVLLSLTQTGRNADVYQADQATSEASPTARVRRCRQADRVGRAAPVAPGPRIVAPVLRRCSSQGREGLERIRADYTHIVSSRGGPRVRMAVIKAPINVQIITACKNVPVWPEPGSGLAAARSRHSQPITVRCARSRAARPIRSGPADQAKAQPMP